MVNRLGIIACVFSIISLIISITIFFKKDKVVYVDSIKLVANYNRAKTLKSEFDLKASQWKSNLDTLASELESEITAYQKEANTLSTSVRQQRETKIDQMKKQYDEYEQAVSENARREDQRITGQVLKEITDFLKEYGEEKKYDFIMGATSVGNIVYADASTDVTEEVLKGLNAQSAPGL